MEKKKHFKRKNKINHLTHPKKKTRSKATEKVLIYYMLLIGPGKTIY